MYIYNITFIIEPSARERVLGWLRGHAVPALFGEGSQGSNPRLQTVSEAGGEIPDSEQGLSIALQGEFPAVEEAKAWAMTTLPPVLDDFLMKFGPDALYFPTLLEVIPLQLP